MRKISNPLIVIGIFVSIAEIIGTIVLPMISQELQQIYIWYVIGFRVLLLSMFFLILYFNIILYYSPNDFADQSNYLRLWLTIENKLKIDTELQKEFDTIKILLFNIKNNIEKKYKNHIEALTLINFRENGVTTKELTKELKISHVLAQQILKDLEASGLVIDIDDIDRDLRNSKRYYIYKGDNNDEDNRFIL